MTPRKKGGLIALQMKRMRERRRLADGQQTGTTKTHSAAQTHERDPKPPQTKRRPPRHISWTDSNPDWSNKWRCDIIYPPTGRDSVTVHGGDVRRLNEGEFLNDNLIAFYLRWLLCQLGKVEPGTAQRIFVHESFFYTNLTNPKKGYASVARWTKNDLLLYDYIIVPVNEQTHWYVAIICNAPKLLLSTEVKGQSRSQDDTKIPKHYKMKANGVPQSTPQKSSQTERKSLPAPRKRDPKEFRIITLDSLGRGHLSTCTNLKDYLVLEAKAKLGIDIPRPGKIGTTAKGIPLQDNYCDCGVFLLDYVKMFLKDPDNFIRRILQNQVGGDMEWPKAPETRVEIRELLFSLQKEQSSETPGSSEVEVFEARQTAESQLQCGGKMRSPAASTLSHLGSPAPDDVNSSVQVLSERDTNDLRSPRPADERSNVGSAEDYCDASDEHASESKLTSRPMSMYEYMD
jgi:Ulp1 family protease